ncbi:hypothetical protein GMDG_03371 [Pseudogymnoascus destructans 20631-21]|uniref:Post-SET domain-containing protein n=1 Tax=Pseudogymnoascus destructans (strain ATCC MYA-4855 / 20631-21) TaxID=658429 RepID=L8G614_PSED2|nr:hypothetical protein GMDG_03371 [Pseudogymnoascus destructans 20631-21]
MAPLTPTWPQPSHGDIQEVVVNDAAFTSKSLSKVTVAPYGVFAKIDFLPATPASEPTYATVQQGRDTHLNLNSDLVYINHSCDPSLILDIPTLSFLAGPRGLRPADELTFFYPSTEWAMAQPFTCFCSSPHCRGVINGAGAMSQKSLEGIYLNGYIRDMLAERWVRESNGVKGGEKARVNGERGVTSRELSGEMGGGYC